MIIGQKKTRPPKRLRFRIKISNREKVVYVLLRKKFQYSINIISEVFGRSRSVIHRILKRAGYAWRKFDLRKLPNKIRRRIASRQRYILNSMRAKYESFILGDSERPP